ncbi:hemerythrin domain-containing protein [Accumulibacter sp.]|uniref:hemerythrin domain-containing protein n=1 Tax=Accumulibacter sp. TaxID=2053492 RepID=UPI0028C39C55|nr:hemerythrin domain-containing protein [Accumulibacter sp.]
MHEVISRLLLEHRNLGKLVGLLDRFPANRIHPTLAEITLLADVFSYLTSFPDLRHHPVEDCIVASLRTRNALLADIGDEIGRQHQVLARQGADLMRDLESAAREETTSWPAVAGNARLYAERLRHNMAVEELALFPLAEEVFDDEDWAAMVTALPRPAPADPLFVSQTEQRFAELRRVIAAEAVCDCFHNPEEEG